ncbi:polysaccharide pyruvyl transferase family protein [Microbacterium sp. LWH3-1.2]|uniref:polysaccharide pyruvyl transferase family protein n=1 Tax=Microbacterium sp. LWH3-1.2 TaxID=3135256 RepID=UPI00341E9138
MPVEVVHWNPIRRRGGAFGQFLPKRPVNNFGDLIGPALVARITSDMRLREPGDNKRLVSVGSIMHFARSGDVVWGTGINGKELSKPIPEDLDVRAVRGPRTRELLQARGVHVPEVFGDPALLWSHFWPLDSYIAENPKAHRREVTVVPNFHDLGRMRGPHVVSPIGSPFDVVRQIALSKFVCGSSLHGIALAESFGIPARLIVPGAEASFKYDDYYAGTGRRTYKPARTAAEAIDMGGERGPEFDASKLLGAFPMDLWDEASR